MALFSYKARSQKGELISGEIDAASVDEAKSKISSDGNYLIDIKEKKDSFDFAKFLQPKVTLDDLMVFNGQLETVFSVGIPLLKGIKFIEEQTVNPTMKKALNDIIHNLSEGMAFSGALAKHPHIFDSTYQSLILAGEATGELEAILSRTSDIIATKMDNIAKIKSALFYPKLVIGFLGIVFLLAVYVIIPKMQKIYAGMGSELPAITKFMITLSEIFTSPIVILGLISVVSLFLYFRATLLDKYLLNIHSLILKIPVIGNIILEIETNSFCYILNLLLINGVTLIDGLKIMRGVLNNQKVINGIAHCEDVLEEGQSFSYGLKTSEVFPPMLVSFVSIGEESGEIDRILEKMAKYYKDKVSVSLDSFSKLIEPVLLFVIFGAVLVLALSIFMPLWQMGKGMKGR